MDIQINENYKLTSDKLNVIVNKKFPKYDGKGKDANLTGEFGWKEIGFHPTIERACNFIMNQEINTAEASSLGELIEVIQTCRDDIKRHISA